MLAEWLVYLLSPCPAHIRKLGYKRAAVGLWSRAGRHGEAWAPHLEASKSFITSVARELPRRRTVLILGSGLLFDVPLPELSGMFEQVILADVVHLLPARLAARNFHNVTFVQADVTGLAEQLGSFTISDLARPIATSRQFLDHPGIDLIVSLNLLSQLPMVPVEYLEGKLGLDEPSADLFMRHVVEAHLSYLRAFAGRVVLITDRERTTLTADGTAIETEDALYSAGFPGELRGPSAEWFWDVAPVGEWDSQYGLRNRVIAIGDLKACC